MQSTLLDANLVAGVRTPRPSSRFTHAGAPHEGFAESLAAVGDLNGDGLGDIAIGAPNNTSRGVDAGRVYIYHGGSLGLPNEMIDGMRANAKFGTYVSGGDMNGDGFAELLVTAGGFADEGQPGPCSAQLLWGSATEPLAAKPSLAFVGEQSVSYCSFRAIIAGDLDRDGFADAIAGINASIVGFMIFPGGADVSAQAKYDGTISNGFGFSSWLSAAGDVNGDGFDDVVFTGEYGGDLYLGKAGPGIPMFSATGGNALGGDISPAGDVNGDGIDDLVVAGYPVRAFFGAAGSGFNTTNDGVLSSPVTGTSFGNAVATFDYPRSPLAQQSEIRCWGQCQASARMEAQRRHRPRTTSTPRRSHRLQ